MDLSVFYNECQLLPSNEKQWVDAFYKTVVDVFGEDEQDFLDLHKVYYLFYGSRSSKLSKAQYYRKRKLILTLYDWLARQGAVTDHFLERVRSLKLQDVVSNNELILHYFKNLDEALNFVAVVGSYKGLGNYDDLLFIKSVVILVWHQVATSELLSLHKSDLKADTHTVTLEDRSIQLDVKYFDILKRFAELDVHKGFPSCRKQVYLSSQFLMRSSQRANLCHNNLQKALERFNAVAVDYGKELSLVSLRRNGIFSKVYFESDHSKTPSSRFQELIGCDSAFAFGYKEFYERWKLIIAKENDN